MAMDLATGIGLGLSGLSTLGGLFGASSAKKKAEEAFQNFIMEQSRLNEREYLDLVTGNITGLASRTGVLNDQLQSTARALGAANAAAGVVNSSALAGSMALFGGEVAQSLANLALQQRLQERQFITDAQRSLYGLQAQQLGSDIQYARQNYANAVAGVQNFLYNLGALFPQQAQQPGKKRSATPASPVSPALFPQYGFNLNGAVPTLQQQNAAALQGVNPWNMNLNLGGGVRSLPTIQERFAAYLQGQDPASVAGLSATTQNDLLGTGAVLGRATGDYVNGTQGAKLWPLTRSTRR
jgi:hypothetical protein